MNAIPRVALVWLLVAQVLVILPHLAYMPLWIAAMWLGCAAWRVQVFRMRAGYPRAWVKLALALLAGAGVWLSRGSLVGLDAGAVLLIAAFILKLVEMRPAAMRWYWCSSVSSQWWWATCSTTVSSPRCTACCR